MKDEAAKSLSRYINVDIPSAGETDAQGNPKGRQVHVKKATLGDWIRLSEIFSEYLGKLGKNQEAFALLQKGIDEKAFEALSKGLPDLLKSIRGSYQEVFKLSTDLQDAEMERLEPDDAITVFVTIWKVNRFKEKLFSLGKVAGGGVGQTPSGSNGSSPISPPEAVTASETS